MDNRPNFGLSSNNPVSIEVLWPSLKISKIDSVYPNQTITIDEKNAKENTTEQEINSDKIFYEKNQDYSIDHNENVFVDFHRNRLMYHMCSTEGPAMAVADINNDGKKEIFMGGSKGFSARLYDLELSLIHI